MGRKLRPIENSQSPTIAYLQENVLFSSEIFTLVIFPSIIKIECDTQKLIQSLTKMPERIFFPKNATKHTGKNRLDS